MVWYILKLLVLLPLIGGLAYASLKFAKRMEGRFTVQGGDLSRVVTEASRDWPIIPLLVGIVLGHLFFSQTALPPRTP